MTIPKLESNKAVVELFQRALLVVEAQAVHREVTQVSEGQVGLA
jgi:hypothetical protein